VQERCALSTCDARVGSMVTFLGEFRTNLQSLIATFIGIATGCELI
jgi:hypothetical protein